MIASNTILELSPTWTSFHVIIVDVLCQEITVMVYLTSPLLMDVFVTVSLLL